MFRVKANYDFIENEKKLLQYWEDNKCFEKLKVKNRNGKKYRFIDGPITANNPMGMHHVWGRTLKDTFLRYKAMNGYTSHYRNGFDGQGLWVEVEVEKELGFKTKKDIEAYGLDKFTEACVERVKKFSEIITNQSKRLGQWMDWDNSYYTYKDNNITSIWAVLKKCHDNGWIKQIYRPMPWCGRCGTSLSEHEMTGSYKEVEHEAVFVKLPLKEMDANILAWTTTPWTLSSNTALAINPKLEYVKVQFPKETKPLILSKAVYYHRFKNDGGKVLDEFTGATLKGLKYETMFPFLPLQQNIDHHIVLWEDVTSDDGSGVVHIAPGCGAEDFELGKKENLDIIMPIDENANFFDNFGFLSGKNAKDVNKIIFEKLEEQGKLFLSHTIKHSYPVCWRCKHEVVFRLEKAWAIDVEELRPKLLENASKVKWNPEYQGKRMEDWLLNMTDWNISRKRFYGLPLPFYLCDCGHLTVIGSKEELRQHAVDPNLVDNLKELHRPWIDDVKIICPHCQKQVNRIQEVGDVWLDAGIVPFSTLKYFEDREYWKSYFPAEYVIEMKEQIRLWFYSLLFMSTVLEDKAPYEQVGTHGMVVSEDGTRFSKTGFMICFEEAAEKIGADASRYIYLSTPPTSDVHFGFSLGEDARRRLLAFWNIIVFFDIYYKIDTPNLKVKIESANLSDIWLENRVNKFTQEARCFYEMYETSGIIKAFEKCVDDVSNWYIRINRKRFWKSEMNDDKLSAYYFLYQAIKKMTKVMAPIIPFMSDWIWQSLIIKVEDEVQSVHLSNYPNEESYSEKILDDVEKIREIINYALKLRNEKNIKIKQPLSNLYLVGFDKNNIIEYSDIINNELNIKTINFLDNKDKLYDEFVSLDFRKAGAILKNNVNVVKDLLTQLDSTHMKELVTLYKANDELKLGEFIIPTSILKLNYKFKDNLIVYEDKTQIVALNIELNDELISEGFYREVLRHCQVLRKEAGYEVTDRILLVLNTSDFKSQSTLKEYQDKLEQETLSTIVTEITNPQYEKTITIDNIDITIKMFIDSRNK